MQSSNPIKRQLYLFILLAMNQGDQSYTNWEELSNHCDINLFEANSKRNSLKNIHPYFTLRNNAAKKSIVSELTRGFQLFEDDITALKASGVFIDDWKTTHNIKPEIFDLALDTELNEEIVKKAYTVVFHKYCLMHKFEGIDENFIPKTAGAKKIRRLVRILYEMLTFETNYSCHLQLMFTKIDYIERYCDKTKSEEALRKQLGRDLELFSEIGIVVKKYRNDTYIISAPRDDDYWRWFTEEEWENLENDFKNE